MIQYPTQSLSKNISDKKIITVFMQPKSWSCKLLINLAGLKRDMVIKDIF